jgi:hypothetical protein
LTLVPKLAGSCLKRRKTPAVFLKLSYNSLLFFQKISKACMTVEKYLKKFGMFWSAP